MRVADPWTVLADPTRRGLLARLTTQPTSVSTLARDLPMSRPAVSQHLRLLLDAGLVEAHPQGRQRIYAARPDGLAALREELDRFWSQALANFAHLTHASPEEPPTHRVPPPQEEHR